MPKLADMELVTACPEGAAFRYLCNMENFGAWFPGVLSITSPDATPHGQVGKTYHERVRMPFRGEVTIPLTVTTCEEGRLFRTQGALRPLLPEMTITLCPTDGARTRIAWRMDSRNESALFRVTLLPLARRVMARRAGVARERLRARLEELAGAATS